MTALREAGSIDAQAGLAVAADGFALQRRSGMSVAPWYRARCPELNRPPAICAVSTRGGCLSLPCNLAKFELDFKANNTKRAERLAGFPSGQVMGWGPGRVSFWRVSKNPWDFIRIRGASACGRFCLVQRS